MSEQSTPKSTIPNISSGGVMLVLIGVLLLLNSLGIVSWGIWFSFLPLLLPLLLIQLGIGIMFSNSAYANLLNVIVLICFTVFGVWRYQTAYANYPTNTSKFTKTIAVTSYPDAKEIDLKIELNGAKLTLNSGAVEANILESDADLFGEQNLNLMHSQTGNKLFVEYLTSSHSNWWNSFKFDLAGREQHTVKLLDKLAYNLNLNNNFGSTSADLNSIQTSDISVENNFGEILVQLGAERLPANLSIDNNFGAVKLRIPKQIDLEIEYKSGFGAIEIAGSDAKIEDKGSLTIDGESQTKMSLNLETNFGSIQIDRY